MVSAIVDSNDKRVGDLITLTGFNSALVQFKISNNYYIVSVYSDRIGDNAGDDNLWYTSNDCSGQAYLIYSQLELVPRWDFSPALGIWISHNPKGVTPQTLNLVTYKSSDNVCHTDPHSLVVVPLITGPDFRAGFTPPFRFE